MMDHPDSHVLERETSIMLQTRSPLMREVFEKVNMVAQTQTSVVLLGETGTGTLLSACATTPCYFPVTF